LVDRPRASLACFEVARSLGWRDMRLLDRYLLRELLVPLAYCLGGFLLFYISFDLIAKLNDFQKHQMLFRDCLEYYLVTTPELLVLILPVAFLLALLYALTNHARSNELTAMRAAGVSLWRLSLPYLAVGLFLSIGLFIINETWVPDSVDKAEQIRRRRETNPADLNWRSNLKFRNEAENRSWDMTKFNVATGEMIKPKIIWERSDGSRRELYAERGSYFDHAWTFYNVEQWDKLPQEAFPKSTNNAILRVEFSETPELINSEIKINSLSATQAAKKPQLSIAEISNYFRLHPQLDADRRAILNTQLQGRLAEPWKCLMVVLIAIPFGARSGRRNVFVGVASSIFICFTYFILQKLALAAGTGNWLPPVVAAWLPNVVFGIAGLWMTLRVR
jgi:lipopolysaccharide export system permease protein